MAKKGSQKIGLFIAAIVILVILGLFNVPDDEPGEPIAPDWAMIGSWPDRDSAVIEAQPDPNRSYTAIVLDDSGSMGGDIEPAKRAVIAAIDAMRDDDAVAVIALNRGLILPFMSVSDARTTLPQPLSTVFSDGSTPLTRAMRTARDNLAGEAARVGGFGTFRILVTTDGQADDPDALRREIEDLARTTPIQLATIGVGVRDDHVLARPDLAAFVTVRDISGLAEALRSAIAEEQDFRPVTEFEVN